MTLMLETRRHPAHSADAHPRAHGALRVPVVSERRAGGRAWLAAIIEKVQSAAAVQASVDERQAVGDRGVHLERPAGARRRRGSLATFPEEFRQGMAARAEILGDTGANASGPLGRRSGEPRPPRHRHPVRPRRRGARALRRPSTQKLLAQCEGVEVLSSLDLEATPPFEYAHDHFGYRDRLSQPVIEGTGEAPTPGSGAPLKAGEFILGYPTKTASPPICRSPRSSPATAATWPTAGWRSTSARSATSCAQHGETPEEQELMAAKLMGRWRSGAPLVLAPDKDDPALGADPQRNNDFNYKEMDPHGYAVPLGSHIRRMNPRDTAREHEPPADDPPRRAPTARPCPRARPRTAWSAASRRS